MSLSPISLAFPVTFAVAAAFSMLAVAAALRRRASLPITSILLAAFGLISISFAAGGIAWDRPTPGKLAVLVDVSSSTRTASYHDTQQLLRRIRELAGDTRYTLYHFADQTIATDTAHLRRGVFSTRTVYAPPADADAILLFSDAQFDGDLPTASPPTHIVLDPALEHPADAAIERLEVRGARTLAVSVRNNGTPRQLMIEGASPATRPVDQGRFVLTETLDRDAYDATVRLSRGDAWIENDSLAVYVPPPKQLERWWVGTSPRPLAGFRHVPPEKFPAELSDFLSAGVIVLDNVPVDAISRLHRERLAQYVRELGGGLLILGGDHAFAAGNYTGSEFDALSPLACDPPTPTTHWIILADSSGSMSASIGDNSRWAFALNAINRLLPQLPPNDPLSVGSFARDLRWWWRDVPVKEVKPRVPADIRPSGPTNVEAALRDVIASVPAEATTPTQLLIITDAETQLAAAEDVAKNLASRHIRVSILTAATATLGPRHPLRLLADATGGRVTIEQDPRQWAFGLRDLMRSGAAPWIMTSTLNVAFTNAAPNLPPISTHQWNRTWLKPQASELAHAADDETIPAIAAWNAGAGAVISVAFRPPPDLVTALADRVTIPPRDPRFSVTWNPGARLRVTLDAVDDGGSRFINNLRPIVELSDRSDASGKRAYPLEQTAPGRYEIAIMPLAQPTIARLLLGGRTIDQVPVAGRYPVEFEAIGNNHAAATKLAQLTGGSVIEPADHRPIVFRWPTRQIPLAPYAAAAGALLFTAALVRWRSR